MPTDYHKLKPEFTLQLTRYAFDKSQVPPGLRVVSSYVLPPLHMLRTSIIKQKNIECPMPNPMA